VRVVEAVGESKRADGGRGALRQRLQRITGLREVGHPVGGERTESVNVSGDGGGRGDRRGRRCRRGAARCQEQ